MKTNMAAASYHPRILSPKYEHSGNVKPLTVNRSLLFAVKWPDLDLKVSNLSIKSVKLAFLVNSRQTPEYKRHVLNLIFIANASTTEIACKCVRWWRLKEDFHCRAQEKKRKCMEGSA